jgi:hypothetical protein
MKRFTMWPPDSSWVQLPILDDIAGPSHLAGGLARRVER